MVHHAEKPIKLIQIKAVTTCSKLTIVELLEMEIAKSKVNDFQCELSESFYDH